MINESDLCLIIKNPETDNKVGIFGEVEGLHGKRLRNKSYWDKKQDFCVFSFGVVKGFDKNIYVEDINISGVDKVCFHFEQKNYIVEDFRKTINFIKQLFLNGPNFKISSGDNEFDYFINLIKKKWNKPVIEIITEIIKFIDGEDLVGEKQIDLGIITDIQA